jgi:hypothetical protein
VAVDQPYRADDLGARLCGSAGTLAKGSASTTRRSGSVQLEVELAETHPPSGAAVCGTPPSTLTPKPFMRTQSGNRRQHRPLIVLARNLIAVWAPGEIRRGP